MLKDIIRRLQNWQNQNRLRNIAMLYYLSWNRKSIYFMTHVIGGFVMVYAGSNLKNEHEGILFGLQILEKMGFKLENTNVELCDFQYMIGFFSLFADKCHQGKLKKSI